jgi:hypothetical protein
MWGNISATNREKSGAKLMDYFEKIMAPTQIAEVQKLARECVRKKYKIRILSNDLVATRNEIQCWEEPQLQRKKHFWLILFCFFRTSSIVSFAGTFCGRLYTSLRVFQTYDVTI